MIAKISIGYDIDVENQDNNRLSDTADTILDDTLNHAMRQIKLFMPRGVRVFVKGRSDISFTEID